MSPTGVKTREILQRLSDHLDMLAGQVCSTEEAVGKALQGQVPQLDLSVTQLQALDFMRQSLEDCALLTLLLAKENKSHFDQSVDADTLAAKLRLEATKSLVKPVTPNAKVVGEVQLF
ncbi:MAG: hypothetical protein V2I76_15285 [Roseobacter sp.]|jgi:hypothetical protein|nr:hypothetical protein [Roseobacter sp.]